MKGHGKMKIGFIGCGNMGSALAIAVSRAMGTKIYISDQNEAKTQAMHDEWGFEISTNRAIAKTCDYVFLAVKPNAISKVAEEISSDLSPSATVVSMAAGVSLGALSEMLPTAKIIRIMPNTPVSIGEGVVLYCVSGELDVFERSHFEDIMQSVGLLDMIDERLIDAASAVSGCGPAFAYSFIEALADGAVACGLPRDKAMLYAASMLKGAAAYALASEKHPGQLKDEVCSPGGSTIEGVLALEGGAFRGTVSDAVITSYEKTKSLFKK